MHACSYPGKRAIIYMWSRGVCLSASFYDFSIRFSDCSDSVVVYLYCHCVSESSSFTQNITPGFWVYLGLFSYQTTVMLWYVVYYNTCHIFCCCQSCGINLSYITINVVIMQKKNHVIDQTPYNRKNSVITYKQY